MPGSRVSIFTATTWKSGPPSFASSASSVGISCRQGTHQVAHRFRSTVLPCQSASDSGLPRGIRKPQIRHLQGCLGDVHGGHLAACQRLELFRQIDRRAAGGVPARVARQGSNPVYPGKPDDQAGENAGPDQGGPPRSGFRGVSARSWSNAPRVAGSRAVA